MNYTEHYDRLIRRARNRELTGYSERHHVVPRCLGGDNAPENKVKLTAEEHYVAHQLLVKMYPDHVGLKWAAMNMTGRSRNNCGRRNKLYGWLRRQVSEATRARATGRVMSIEARGVPKMSAARLGTKRGPHSAETKARMSAAAIGRPKSSEHRLALSAARTGLKYATRRSEESRARSSAAVKAAFARGARKPDQSSPEARARQSERMTLWWTQRKAG